MPLLLRLSLPPSPSPLSAHSSSLQSPSSPRPVSLRFPPRSSFRSIRSPRSQPPPSLSASPGAFSGDDSGEFDEELSRLLALLPEEFRRAAEDHPERRQLIEVVMDLGRKPLARFPSGDFVLSDRRISSQDLHRAKSQVGDFAMDNRAGISRTLHRISSIKNRKGSIVGLTCRVGRAVSGSAGLLRDLVKDGGSLLLIGPPGVGKTTIIRDIARMLADDYKKRVMIVDTSNEIGGDGDIPHAGIGSARRMQVPNPDSQHKVMKRLIGGESRRLFLSEKDLLHLLAAQRSFLRLKCVHRSLEATVDALLAGRSPNFEVRKIDPKASTLEIFDSHSINGDKLMVDDHPMGNDEKRSDSVVDLDFAEKPMKGSNEVMDIYLYVYGENRPFLCSRQTLCLKS